MLPTPDTSHVPYNQVYEPAEDSFLFLDTLSSPAETTFLHQRFHPTTTTTNTITPAPLVVEIGTGSGVVISFVHAHARALLGAPAVLTAGIDINAVACAATRTTVAKAAADSNSTTIDNNNNNNTAAVGQGRSPGPGPGPASGHFLGALQGDLLSPLRAGEVDVLLFNPPYVPTEVLPAQDDPRLLSLLAQAGAGAGAEGGATTAASLSASARFERDSYLLSLSYAGGRDGMETTDRVIEALPGVLSRRGCAYILLCAGNKPEEVKARIVGFGPEWRVLTVGDSGKQAGWEKLQIIRIWRE